MAYRDMPFDDMPAWFQASAYGVDYIRIHESHGGLLFLTRHGWPFLSHLFPEQWYLNQRYVREGLKLAGGTGSVYRVRSNVLGRGWIDLVVKFSRVGQDVPLALEQGVVEHQGGLDWSYARFNDPFQEFGLLTELRHTPGADGSRMLTKRPLAVYCPPDEAEAWQLGRKKSRFTDAQRRLRRAQAQSAEEGLIELSMARDYILLFGWLKGTNAEDLYDQGVLSEPQLLELSARVTDDLAQRGFEVLDNKPKHYILRRRENGEMLCRRGRPVYGLVDFELLQRR